MLYPETSRVRCFILWITFRQLKSSPSSPSHLSSFLPSHLLLRWFIECLHTTLSGCFREWHWPGKGNKTQSHKQHLGTSYQPSELVSVKYPSYKVSSHIIFFLSDSGNGDKMKLSLLTGGTFNSRKINFFFFRSLSIAFVSFEYCLKLILCPGKWRKSIF